MPDAQDATSGAEADHTEWLSQIPLSEVRPNRYQPRRQLEPDSLAELADSIREQGVLQPIVVRPRDDGFELVAGERRWRAAAIAGLTEIPAVVRDLSDRQAAVLALLENLQREDLHFFEEAEGYRRIMALFDLTQRELAQQLGKSQGTVANRLRLLNLPDDVRTIISREMLSERHARALLSAPSADRQRELAETAARQGWTVRQLEAQAAKPPTPRQRRTTIVRDARIFINEFRKVARALRKQGFDVSMQEAIESEHVRLEITIRRSATQAPSQ